MGFFQPLATEEQQDFYDELADGKVSRSVWNMEKRFHGDHTRAGRSFSRYFTPQMSSVLTTDKDLVDIGCGNGLYLPLVAPLCRSVTGIELTPSFAAMAQKVIEDNNITNASVQQGDGTATGFDDDSYDTALVVDTLHHVFDLDAALDEIARIVRPGGDVLVIEPNLTNPLLLVLHALDKNERGAVSRCYMKRYHRVFDRHFDVVTAEYNGLLIGPTGKLATGLADFMQRDAVKPVLGRFSPHLFFHLRTR